MSSQHKVTLIINYLNNEFYKQSLAIVLKRAKVEMRRGANPLDKNIPQQKPDGPEILRARKRARIDAREYIHWTELCFCPTPLHRERTTVYDH